MSDDIVRMRSRSPVTTLVASMPVPLAPPAPPAPPNAEVTRCICGKPSVEHAGNVLCHECWVWTRLRLRSVLLGLGIDPGPYDSGRLSTCRCPVCASDGGGL